MGGATPCSAHDAHFTTPAGGARKRAATRAEHRWIVNEPACKPDTGSRCRSQRFQRLWSRSGPAPQRGVDDRPRRFLPIGP